MSKNNFIMHYVIGRGGFGKVKDIISKHFRSGELKRKKLDSYMR